MVGLDNKSAIVTGAASGIGKAIAWQLAQEGATVFLADLNGEGAEQTAAMFHAQELQAFHRACDVSNAVQVEQMVVDAARQMGKIDILVNCAGISPVGRVTDISEAEFRRVLDINLVAIFLTSKYTLPYLIQTQGCIINI